MFFPKLRKRAKWVFVLLAAAFGIGFVGFGIGGTGGGGGIADAIGDIFGRTGNALPSSGEAQERLANNPDDPEARQAFADALFGEQRFDEARVAYESYLELAPDDTQALRQVALIYQSDWAVAQGRANRLQQIAAQADPGTAILFDPTSTPFTQALARNQFEQAVAGVINDDAIAANEVAAVAAEPWVATLERIAEIEPNSPTTQLQLGQAAEQSSDFEGAVAAYLRALELDPAGGNALTVRDRLQSLGGEIPEELNALVEETAANPTIDPNAPIFEQSGPDGPAPGPSGSIGERSPIGNIGDSGTETEPDGDQGGG